MGDEVIEIHLDCPSESVFGYFFVVLGFTHVIALEGVVRAIRLGLDGAVDAREEAAHILRIDLRICLRVEKT